MDDKLKEITQEELDKLLNEKEKYTHEPITLENLYLYRLTIMNVNRPLKITNCKLSFVDIKNCNLNYSIIDHVTIYNSQIRDTSIKSSYVYALNCENTNIDNLIMNFSHFVDTNNIIQNDIDNSSFKCVESFNTLFVTCNSFTSVDLYGFVFCMQKGTKTNSTFSNNVLYRTNLSKVNFKNTIVEGNIADTGTSFYHMVCPEEGSYIGWKKCNSVFTDKAIVKLLIMEDSLRSSATSRKCRASKVKVLAIYDIYGNQTDKEAYSRFDNKTVYRVGDIITVDDFDTNRWNECSSGIHHFITREEAEDYSI